MNRKEIKNKAKELVKGNKFSLFWPLFLMTIIELFSIIIFTIPYLYTIYDKENTYANIRVICILGLLIVTLLCVISFISYKYFILDYINNDRFDYEKILDCMKNNFGRFIASILLISLLTIFGTAFLIIPGIIIILSYEMSLSVVMDNDLGIFDSMKESRRLMKNHRIEYLLA